MRYLVGKLLTCTFRICHKISWFFHFQLFFSLNKFYFFPYLYVLNYFWQLLLYIFFDIVSFWCHKYITFINFIQFSKCQIFLWRLLLSVFQYFEFGRWMYFEISVKIVQHCSQQKLPFFVLFFKNFSSTLAVIPYAKFMFSDPSWKKLTTTFLNQK